MSKRDEMKEKRRRQEQRNRLMIIGAVGILAIVVAGVLILQNLPDNTPVGVIVTVAPNPRPQANGLSMGDPKAPVKIEEFADFQCPTCKLFYESFEPEIVSKYIATGKVFFSYRPFSFIDDFPGATGSESKNAAAAAYCANDQGKFWEYHDILLSNQNGENQGAFSNKRLIAFASSIGLDSAKFTACVTSKKYAQAVLNDNTYSEAKGVSETPSFIVNGKLVILTDLTATIDAALIATGK
jgi:protein-disulfide isomerase